MGHYGKIEGISSLAFQHNIVSFGGIIDELDTNTIQIKMFNFGTGTYRVKRGDCIAQLIIQRYCVPNIQQVLSVTATD
jgi:dUTPase